MATTCSCGCGRSIKGLRLRAWNGIALEMSSQLDALTGALDHGETGDRATDVAHLAAEGTAQLVAITPYLHGEIDRSDLDKDATTDWLGRAKAMSRSLVEGSSGPAWEPDDPRTERLALSGTRARGVVTEVDRSAWGNERTADLTMAVACRAPDGSRLELRRTLSIAVVKAPRVGDQVEVAYDPDEPDRFVYRPVVDLPGVDPA